MAYKKNFFPLLIALIFNLIFISGTAAEETESMPEGKDPVGNLLLQSMNLIGIPYKWGGNTPTSGLDCSGFIRYVYKKSLGITLPRTAAEMAQLGKNIPIDELEPGDLIFFSHKKSNRITHVGMYIGHNQFIQSPETGKTIQITEFDAHYRSRFNRAKRIVQTENDTNGDVKLVDLHTETDDNPKVTTKTNKSGKSHNRNRRRRVKHHKRH